MKIRTGDNVLVISGKDKGKTGTVLRVLPNKSRVVVASVNMRTRHMRATPQQPGQKVQYEASIHVSNVMIVDSKTKKRTRIGMGTDAKGHKVRIARSSGEAIAKKAVSAGKKSTDATDKKSESQKVKKSESKKDTKVTKAEKTDKTKVATETVDAPPSKKKPFWKKMVDFGGEAAEDAEVEGEAHMKADHSIPDDTPPAHRPTSRGS